MCILFLEFWIEQRENGKDKETEIESEREEEEFVFCNHKIPPWIFWVIFTRAVLNKNLILSCVFQDSN